MPVKGEKEQIKAEFLLLIGWSEGKSRVLCLAFPWVVLNWINTELHKISWVRILAWWLQMPLKAPVEALPCICSSFYQAKPSRAAWTHCLHRKQGLWHLQPPPEGEAFRKDSSDWRIPDLPLMAFKQATMQGRLNSSKTSSWMLLLSGTAP